MLFMTSLCMILAPWWSWIADNITFEQVSESDRSNATKPGLLIFLPFADPVT